jgi:hypothetical protein
MRNFKRFLAVLDDLIELALIAVFRAIRSLLAQRLVKAGLALAACAVAIVCALECATFGSSPQNVQDPPRTRPTHVLGVPIAELDAADLPECDQIETASPAELDELQRDVDPLRSHLASAERMIDELYGLRQREPDGTWRFPVALVDTNPSEHRLARAFRAQALLAARRGDPTRAARFGLTVLRLASILESQPIGDAPDLWLSRPHFLRCMLSFALRDPRTIQGADPAELERLRALLAEHEPPADLWARVVLAMPDALTREAGSSLYAQRGASLGDSWLERIVYPQDAAERGLWVETARERLHQHAERMVALVTADHDATTDALKALNESVTRRRTWLGKVMDALRRRMSSVARAEEMAGITIEHVMTSLFTMRNMLAWSLQGQRLLLLRVRLEQVRQATGRYPDTLPVEERYRRDVVAGRPLIYERTGDGYRLEAQDTRHVIWKRN